MKKEEVVFVTVNHVSRSMSYFIRAIEENFKVPVTAIFPKGDSRKESLEEQKYYCKAHECYPVRHDLTRASLETQVDILSMSSECFQKINPENFPSRRAYVFTENKLFYVEESSHSTESNEEADDFQDPWAMQFDISHELLQELKEEYQPPSYENDEAAKRLSYRELKILQKKINHQLDTFTPVFELIKSMVPEGKKACIVDDGGYFSEFVGTLISHPESIQLIFSIVEFTQNGELRYRKLFEDPLFCQNNKVMIHSIARSKLKEKMADREVGPDVVRAANYLLQKEAYIISRDLPVVVFGCGRIGDAIAEALKDHREVRLFDINPESAERVRRFFRLDQCKTYGPNEKKELFKGCQIVFSATGNKALEASDIINFMEEDTVIFSVTSAADEMHPNVKSNFISKSEKGCYLVSYVHQDPEGKTKKIKLACNGDAVNFVLPSVLGPGLFLVFVSTLLRLLSCFDPDKTKRPKTSQLNELTLEESDHIEKVAEPYFGKIGHHTETFGVYKSLRKFIGREGPLNDLRKTLIENQRGIISQRVSGLGGIGKTTLAREYVVRSLEDRSYDFIIWINASTVESVYNDFVALALKLNIATREEIKKFKPSDLIRSIYDELAKYRRVLMIFDNAEEFKNINKAFINGERVNFLPPLYEDQLLHWVTTTRTRGFIQSAKKEELIELSQFSLEEAREYILEYCKEEEAQIDLLAETLHYFPLALSQALAYIWKNKITIDQYLALYQSTQKNRRKLLNSDVAPEDYYQETVYTTWDVSLQALRKKSPYYDIILNVCAYYNSDNIPVNIIENILKGYNIDNFREILQDFQQYSLLEWMEADTDHAKIKFHAIVQDVILLKQAELTKGKNVGMFDRPEFLYLSLAIIFLKEVHPLKRNQIDEYDLARELFPHTEKLLTHLKEYPRNRQVDTRLADLYINLIDQFYMMGKESQACSIAREMLTLIDSAYGKNDIHYAYALCNAANTAGHVFFYDEQCQYLEEALLIFSEQARPNDPNDEERIIHLLIELASTYNKIFGINKQLSELSGYKLELESNRQLASFLQGSQSKEIDPKSAAMRAIELFEQASRRLEINEDANPLRLMIIFSELSMLYVSLEQKEKAVAYLNRASALIQFHHEPDQSISILNEGTEIKDAFGAQALMILARAYQVARRFIGKSDQPEKLIEFALPIIESAFGKNHPTTGMALYHLSDVFARRGKCVHERVLLMRSLSILEPLGDGHIPLIKAKLEEIENNEICHKLEEIEKMDHPNLEEYVEKEIKQHGTSFRFFVIPKKSQRTIQATPNSV